MLKYNIQLVRFLVENKHTLATINSIAYHLNEPVESDVQELEKLGLVVRSPYDALSAAAHHTVNQVVDHSRIIKSKSRQSGIWGMESRWDESSPTRLSMCIFQVVASAQSR